MLGFFFFLYNFTADSVSALPPSLFRTLGGDKGERRELTVLLEDMELSVLMLLASVTTIAEGNRDGWEYWGGSCLCEYTAKSKRRERIRFPDLWIVLIRNEEAK